MKYKHAWSVNGTSYSGDWTLPILEKKSFDDLVSELDGDPATRPAKQINKILQSRTQNIKTVYTSML